MKGVVTIPRIARTYRNIVRLRQILDVLLAEGLGFVVVRMNLHKLLRLPRRIRRYLTAAPTPLTLPQQLRRVVEELGPTFIKFGQMLASRPDLLPAAYVRELSRLQDRVTPLPFEQIRPELERELKGPVEEVFRSFGVEPLASASLAQVYGAVLASGEEVVVKVQRPGVRELIRNDLDIFARLATLVSERFPEVRPLDPAELVEEFSLTIKRELDFATEAANTERLRQNLADVKGVRVPRVFWDYTTERVLVVERLYGMRADDVAAVERAGLSRDELARRLVECFMKQVFEDGFYHADPHAGNVLFSEAGELALVDCGAVGYLTKEFLTSLGALMMACNAGDYERVATEVIRMGAADTLFDTARFKSDAAALVGRYYAMPLRYITLGPMWEEVAVLARRHGVQLPREFVMLAKTVALVENLAHRLAPDLKLVALAEPFARGLVKDRYAPAALARAVGDSVHDLSYYLREAPRELTLLVKRLVRGGVKVGVEHQGLANAVNELDRSSNRLSFSLIVAAIIVSSALVFVAGAGPQVYGFSAIGVVGFVVAAILGLWLALAMLRSGRL